MVNQNKIFSFKIKRQTQKRLSERCRNDSSLVIPVLYIPQLHLNTSAFQQGAFEPLRLKKVLLRHIRTAKAQISLRIHAV